MVKIDCPHCGKSIELEVVKPAVPKVKKPEPKKQPAKKPAKKPKTKK